MSQKPNAKSLTFSMVARTPEQAAQIARLRKELAPIVRRVTSGDFTAFNVLLLNKVIAECRGRLNPFEGVDSATESIADAFEAAVLTTLKKP